MVERSTSNHQFICQNSQTPQVHRHVVLFSFQYLRSSVVKCSTISFSSLIANSSPAEVTKLTNSMRNNNVFRLDITMSNTLLMQVLYCLCYLLQPYCSLYLTKSFLLLQLLKKGSFLHIVKNKINVLSIIKAAIKSENVLVLTEWLYLDF